jgi:hypothetical protein
VHLVHHRPRRLRHYPLDASGWSLNRSVVIFCYIVFFWNKAVWTLPWFFSAKLWSGADPTSAVKAYKWNY